MGWASAKISYIALVVVAVGGLAGGSTADAALAATESDNTVHQGPTVSLAEISEIPPPPGPPIPPPQMPDPPAADRSIDAPPVEGSTQPPSGDPSPGDSLPAAASPTPTSSFQAILSNQVTSPPDTHGAVGNDHLMVVLNTEFQFQTKTGTVLEKMTIQQFWSPLQGGTQDQRCTKTFFDVFDPKVTYDTHAKRWVVTTIFCRRDAGSGVFLAVSKSADPTGDWKFYSIDADSSDTDWADYPSIGVNGKWIIISYNMFSNAEDDFIESELGIFEKEKAYDETLASFTLATDPGATLVPAHAPANNGDAYLVGSWRPDLGCLRVTKVTGTASSPTYANSSPVFPGWNGTQCAPAWSQFAFASNSSPQLGGDLINAGDHRMLTCRLISGSIWCAHTVFLPESTGARGAAQWWQFTPAGEVLQRGIIQDTSGKYHYTYPSLAVNGGGDALVGFSRFATDEYPSAGYAYRASGDAPNTMRTEEIYRSGQAPYVDSSLRWGDYSASQVDPTDDKVFWTIQEFSANHVASMNWGTWWAKIDTNVVAPPPDTSPPTWPDQTFRADVFERTLTLEWKAAKDNVGVEGYVVVQAPGTPVNGVFQGKVIAVLGKSVRSYKVTGLLPATSYAFWVEAFDAAENVSSDGPLRVFTTATDFGDTNGHTFHDDIAWLAGAGITKGCNPPANTMFCPEDPVTRGQMASFLVRALGLTGGEGSNFFTDDDNSPHETNIDRLAFWEITFGCNPSSVPPNTRFCPDDSVTRAQMASFLVRALILVDGWNIDYFDDDDFSVHEFDINRLAHSGLTKGCNPPLNTLFCPTDPVTRGQMAAFLHRAKDNINVIRDLLELPLLGDKNEAASELVPLSVSP